MLNIIQEIIPSIIDKKGSRDALYKGFSNLSESSKESNSVKTIVIKENEAISHKQRRKARPKKVKWLGFKVGRARVS